MLKTLAASAAAALLWSTAAQAATFIIDFEGNTPGSLWRQAYDGAMITGGTIASEGGNTYLSPQLRSAAHPNTKLLTLNGENTAVGEFISPQLLGLDVFIAGGGELIRPGMGGPIQIVADQWVTLTFAALPATDLNCVWGCNYFFHGGDVRIDNIVLDVAIAHVPEPGTWAMLIAGFGLSGAALRRSRRQAASVMKKGDRLAV